MAKLKAARRNALPKGEFAQANAEPQIDEIDPATKKPKFATFNDYLKAHAKWNREEAIREIRADGARNALAQRARGFF